MRRCSPTLLIANLALMFNEGAFAEPIPTLTKASEVKQWGLSLPKGTALLMKYYTPWCGHCRLLGPALEMAKEAVELWDAEDANPTVFGQIDCEASPATCKKLGATAFPSLKFYNNQGNAYLEYPRLPRSADSLTAYLARYRRVVRPYPLVLRYMYTERHCSSTLKFKDSICRGFRIENYLVGGADGFQKFNKIFKNAPTAFLEFVDPAAPSNQICIIDRFTREERYCTSDFDPEDESALAELKKKLLLHRHPYVIQDATWFDFFHLRVDTSKQRVVVISNAVLDNIEDLQTLAREHLDGYHFLTSTADTQGIFDQAGVSSGVIVFESDAYDRGFYYLSSERIQELSTWLSDIKLKTIIKQFPPGHRSAMQDIKDAVISLPEVIISGFKSLSLRRKIQLLITGVGIILAWLYLVQADQIAAIRSRRNSTAAAAPPRTRAGKISAVEAKDSRSGVCLINGEIATPAR